MNDHIFVGINADKNVPKLRAMSAFLFTHLLPWQLYEFSLPREIKLSYTAVPCCHVCQHLLRRMICSCIKQRQITKQDHMPTGTEWKPCAVNTPWIWLGLAGLGKTPDANQPLWGVCGGCAALKECSSTSSLSSNRVYIYCSPILKGTANIFQSNPTFPAFEQQRACHLCFRWSFGAIASRDVKWKNYFIFLLNYSTEF